MDAFNQRFNFDQLILQRIQQITYYYDRVGMSPSYKIAFVNAVKGLRAVLAGEADDQYFSDLEDETKSLEKEYATKRKDTTKLYRSKVSEQYEIDKHYIEFLCLNKLIKRLRNSM